MDRMPLLFRDGSPIQASHPQKMAIDRVDIGERTHASQNLKKGEKLLFVHPSLWISTDSVSTNGEAGEVMKRYDVPDWPLLATYLISEGSLRKDSRCFNYISALMRRTLLYLMLHVMCRRLIVMSCIRHS